jgi:hypothetical protein
MRERAEHGAARNRTKQRSKSSHYLGLPEFKTGKSPNLSSILAFPLNLSVVLA